MSRIKSVFGITNEAKQIAESSQNLAEGAVTQSSSVEELNASITDINEKTQTNAQNAVSAETLVNGIKNPVEGLHIFDFGNGEYALGGYL